MTKFQIMDDQEIDNEFTDPNGSWRRARLVKNDQGQWIRTGRLIRVNYVA